MLMQLFLNCLAVSLLAGLLILLLWALHPITGRLFGAKWQYYSWLPVLLLLLLPLFMLSINTIGGLLAGLADSLNWPADITTRQPETELSVSGKAELIQVPNQKNLDYIAQNEDLSEYQITLGKKIYANVAGWEFWPYLAAVWLAGVAALLIGLLLIYAAFRWRLHKNSVQRAWQALPLDSQEIALMRQKAPNLQLRQQTVGIDKIILPAAPFVIGLRRPCLLLPEASMAAELSVVDWRNLLRHELTHYERRDLLYKWLLLACQCLHWFNPLVYLLGRQIEQDCEISCDLAVTGLMTEPERRDYMRTILRMLEPLSKKGALGLAGGLHTSMSADGNKIQRRFVMISKHKINNHRWRRLALFCSILLVAMVMSGGAMAMAQVTNLGLYATIKPLDNGVVWDVDNNVVLNANSDGLVVYNNGEALELTNHPFVADGRIYLPLREILEKFRVIEANDESSLQYEDGLVKLELYQWLNDAAGGRVRHCFYLRQFSLTDEVGAQMRDNVLYVPAEMIMGIAQMSAAAGGSILDGLMILQYDQNGGEILRLISLPVPSENKTVHITLPLAEQFAVVPQFIQAWQQSDYQKMQSFCTSYVLDSVGWQYADDLLGEAAAVYAEQFAAEPNSLDLHVLIKRNDGSSGYSELALNLAVERQQDDQWLISSLRSSNRDTTPLSEESEQHWQWPLDDKYHIISYGFGGPHQHSGIDIPAVNGAPVYAAAAGQVVSAGYMDEDGNKVILQHSQYGDWETRYAHLSRIAVQAGDTVEAGQIIGYVGSSGQSTGNHLHFVMMQGGQPLDPMEFWEQ